MDAQLEKLKEHIMIQQGGSGNASAPNLAQSASAQEIEALALETQFHAGKRNFHALKSLAPRVGALLNPDTGVSAVADPRNVAMNLGGEDFAFLLQHFFRHIVARCKTRLGGGDVHGASEEFKSALGEGRVVRCMFFS